MSSHLTATPCSSHSTTGNPSPFPAAAPPPASLYDRLRNVPGKPYILGFADKLSHIPETSCHVEDRSRPGARREHCAQLKCTSHIPSESIPSPLDTLHTAYLLVCFEATHCQQKTAYHDLMASRGGATSRSLGFSGLCMAVSCVTAQDSRGAAFNAIRRGERSPCLQTRHQRLLNTACNAYDSEPPGPRLEDFCKCISILRSCVAHPVPDYVSPGRRFRHLPGRQSSTHAPRRAA